MRKSIISLALTTVSLVFSVCSCSNNQGERQSYDGRTYDISVAQDRSVIATSKLENNYYSITITGGGDALTYTKKELVPWNPIAKRVNKVTIENGIFNIGDYYFYSINLDYIILPESVGQVEDHSFGVNTIIYTYGSILSSTIPNKVYYYRESKPATPGNYFYMEDGIPHPYIYNTPSFLFIGNSFTYKQGDESNPSVPLYFQKIASNLGISTTIDFVVRGSYTLTKYANPNDELGAIVESKLTTKKYDYVILQEQSTTPINNYNTFLAAATKLKTRIDQTQTNCQTILYETWGSPTGIQGTSFKTVGEMEMALRTAYTNAGQETGCKVNYIGKAFTYAFETLNFNVFSEDDRHQSALGAYLSAACHVRSIFNIKVANCTEYCGLDQTGCKTLLGAADYII